MNHLVKPAFCHHREPTENLALATPSAATPAFGGLLRLCPLLVALWLSSVWASAREGTEWMTSYWYNANDTKLPRVLLVGDSICNGYQTFVRDELAGTASVSFYATSKCASDPTYLKALAFMLEEYDYQVVHFNNGLHSLSTDRKAWENGLVAALNLIKEKGKGAKIIWATSTPLKDPALTAKAKELNLIAGRVMRASSLPVDDLFALMDPLDRNVFWVDTYHYREDARKMQARQVADHVLAALGAKKASAVEARAALASAASETGPNGKITTTSVVPDALANPGFEGTGGWSIYPPAPAKGSMEIAAENPHSGAKAAKLTVNSPGLQFYQPKPKLEPGTAYTLKYWARAAASSTVNVFLRTTKPPYQFFGKSTGKLEATWQACQVSFTLPADFSPADHTLIFEFPAPGTYWFDDISFSKP
ncbi:MAG: carbohydrate binding domain-containing protein [Verrucomicrobiota bacterium]